jgi:hypothetical protein
MADWIKGLSTGQLVLFIIGVLVVLSVLAALLTRWLVLRGLHTPWAIRLVNRGTDKVVDFVKRPITVAVLDEVSVVLQSGHYTKNISAALVENQEELRQLVAEKVRQDPSSRIISRLPMYDAVVNQVTETTLRVLVEMLGDPRMDELISDLIRHNLDQIKAAVRARQHENDPEPTTPVPVTPSVMSRP